MKRPIQPLAAVLLLSLSYGAFATPWRDLYGDLITFDVFRDGERVGYYETRFVGESPRWQVEVQLELEVTWLLWRYRYHYRSTETWKQGLLTDLKVHIDNNGKVRQHRFTREGDMLRSDSGVVTALPVLATHHYDVDVVEHERVINTLTGRIAPVRVEKTGPEPFYAAGGTLPAVSYRYLGDEKERGSLAGTEAWYDLEGRWVGLRFLDSRGSEVELRCRRCGLEGPP